MYYDAHTHLNSNQLFLERNKHLQDFCQRGGKGLINIGVDHIYNQRALEISQQRTEHDRCWVKAALGYHPGIVAEQDLQKSSIPLLVADLKEQILTHRQHVVALGEIGVDLYRGESAETKLIQQELFHQQCMLARELDLPIVIHSRTAFDETMEILDMHTDLRIYFHCWGYTPRELARLSAFYGRCWVGFCGNVSYPKAQDIRDSLSWVYTHPEYISLLIETDAPYLALQSERGSIQTPSKIEFLYIYIAEQLGIYLADLQEMSKKNIYTLYGLA